MKILNFGSVNIDHVYAVAHFVKPGETLASGSYEIFAGGKGFNQSIALARAGAAVAHVGAIGRDGAWLLGKLQAANVGTEHLKQLELPTGHAIIQVIPSGENSIILHAGANAAVTVSDLETALAASGQAEFMLLQNETSAVAEAISLGRRHNLKVVFNPAPMSAAVQDYPLHEVDIFVLNETEAEFLAGSSTPDGVRDFIMGVNPRAAAVLTLGRAGAVYADANGIRQQPGINVKAVDTTAAGDTFTGFFIAELMRGSEPETALELGCRAAAVTVTRPGASDSIPQLHEVKSQLAILT